MGKIWKKHILVRVGLIFLGVLCILLLAVVLFLKLWTAFGGSASKEDREDYAKRAENYRDGKFYNDGDFQIVRETDRTDEHIISTNGTKPEEELPAKTPSYDQELSEEEIRVTWFGHSSMLLQMHGMNILIDPVFSERNSPVSFVGIKRFSHPPVSIEDLPSIDLLVLSHDHYDHLDYHLIKEMDKKVDRYIVPLGVENHLERWGVDSHKIQNMAWWEETTVNGLTIGCTPARHYSGRSLNDQFATLWASWVFQDGHHKVFESGDSGYGEHFQKIHDKYRDFDFVLIDCAQYDVNWPEVHMFPEEAVQAVQTLGAKAAMPIHWGAFALANHGWDDPVERFVAAGETAGLQVATPYIGETVNLNALENSMERWWKDIEDSGEKESENTEITPASEIASLEDGLASVQYSGDYGFSEFLSQGGAVSDSEVMGFLTEHLFSGMSGLEYSGDVFGCSTLSVKSPEGDYLFGRNFDWNLCEALVVSSEPEEGYVSLSTVNMDFIAAGAGTDVGQLPEQMKIIAALYAPLDGMNEKGLCVSVNMIQDSATIEQDTDKPDITTTTAVRLLLDRAADVEEALDLLKQYDLHASMGMMVHFALADASGRSVVVEYIENEMAVTDTPVVTNFYLAPGKKQGIGTEQSHTRYEILTELLGKNETMDMQDVREALDSVSKDNFGEYESTEWSIVYNQRSGEVWYYHRENYEKAYTFRCR